MLPRWRVQRWQEPDGTEVSMATRVVVIGGGITGTLTAVKLQRAGFSVVLVEARHIGAGSSSRTAAGIRQQFSTHETVLGMRHAVDVYRRFPEEVGGMISPIVENGYLFLIADEAGMERAAARVATQHGAGLHEVALLDAAETARRFPFVDPRTIAGATHCPSDGFLRPEVVYGEAAASARGYGVDIRQGAPVDAVRTAGDRITAVRAGGAWIEAALFVDATNAWSPRLARVLGAEPLPIRAEKRFLWFLGRGTAFSPGEMVGMPMVIAPGGAYCHPENAETLMTGWAHDAADEPDFTHDDQDHIPAAFHHRSGVEGRGYETWAALAETMPVLEDLDGIHATTCGFYGVTPDHNPFFGFDRCRPNLIRAVGFSGHGAMFGPFTATVVAALAAAGRDLDAVEVLGEAASLAPFRLGRAFEKHESMVI